MYFILYWIYDYKWWMGVCDVILCFKFIFEEYIMYMCVLNCLIFFYMKYENGGYLFRN